MTLHIARLSMNRELGLAVADTETALTAAQLLIDGTLAQASDNRLGQGMSVHYGGKATVEHARLTANRHRRHFLLVIRKVLSRRATC